MEKYELNYEDILTAEEFDALLEEAVFEQLMELYGFPL